MSLEQKMKRLDAAVADLRHTVRHSGGAVRSDASIAEVVDHMLDFDMERLGTMYEDIGTIDHVKAAVRDSKTIYPGVYKSHRQSKFPVNSDGQLMTTQELLQYAVDDERLTAKEYSWAVVRITAQGTEVLTCGGNYYQGYYNKNEQFTVTEDHTEEVTEKYTEIIENAETGEITKVERLPGDTVQRTTGDTVKRRYIIRDYNTDMLKNYLGGAEAAWNAEMFEADIHDAAFDAYTEGGVAFIRIPCQLPGDLGQLLSICITRTKLEDNSEASSLSYSLTDKSCDTSNPGMVELPHGIWLIYDNSELASAPQGLMFPKDLADGTDTGFRMDKVRILYNSEADGLLRLRLVGDSFGSSYIVSTQEPEKLMKGAWSE